jgi:chromatin structure-remodeling complex subunit RSC9
MTLSVRSGIHSEISWALNRLCHLSLNENFHFVAMPGLIDSLFDWPEWYIKEGHKLFEDKDVIFSTSPQVARQHRFALESLFVIRNAVPVEENAKELATHSRTLSFIMNTLHNLDPSRDENTEFLQHTLDIFNIVAATYYVVPHHNPVMNPFPPLFHIVSTSSNRTTIIVAMNALTALFSNPVNGVHLKSDSLALTTSIRYLPLFNDKPLIDTCVNYLYAHVTHPSMARAFLFHPDMPRVLKVLANLLIHEQLGLEKTYTLDITGTVHTVPSDSHLTRDHELTQEEMDSLVSKPEPQRCYDWYDFYYLGLSQLLRNIFRLQDENHVYCKPRGRGHTSGFLEYV